MAAMETETYDVPPGFRFHPTEEELVGYYLARKVASQKFDLDVIKEVDLYRIEPWDLLEKCKVGSEEQSEWYFFSHKDKKYPSGTRTNRATAAGFWKATGRDKAVLSKSKVIGMRKTLVFYQGRAPNGRKTDWIMHEYRLQSSDQHGAPQEEGWVVCRAFRKPIPNQGQSFDPMGSNLHQLRFESAMDDTQIVLLGESYQGPDFQNELLGRVLEIPQLSTAEGFDLVEDDGLGRRGEGKGETVEWKSLDKLLCASSQCNSSNAMMMTPIMECEGEMKNDEHDYFSSIQS